ncbi:unnamed protein product [Colletotrichum noveboracense]|uniref:Uncharacterized protein n=1 Tax=Colletotrichum noveboracense TaxID=2664923 RepID=A0A9W4WDK4_9PEZI|nr:unnamed protein product [Colletotrichum noveboracense]
MWVDDGGSTYTWTTSRSCRKEYAGDGLNFAWRQAFYKGASSGPTHMGMGGTNLRTRIHFARIYGQSSVFGNLPLQDYVYLEHIKLAEDKHRFEMRVWKNIGGGGSKIVADGNKYCNMVGHRDGRADYVWTQSTGEITLFTNRGKGTIGILGSKPWHHILTTSEHGPSGSAPAGLGRGCDCDIIYVNPETNAVEVFLNQYPQTGSWGWAHLTNPAPGLICGYNRGLGDFDLAVCFADLTGTNRADYLYITPDGTVSGYLQQDSGAFVDVGQIKFAIGKDRANLR